MKAVWGIGILLFLLVITSVAAHPYHGGRGHFYYSHYGYRHGYYTHPRPVIIHPIVIHYAPPVYYRPPSFYPYGWYLR